MGEPTFRRASLRWEGGLRFRGGEEGAPTTLLDADGVDAPGPFVGLILSAGACAAADVVDILTKMRVVLAAVSVELIATRRDEHPRRLMALELVFHLEGSGLTEPKATRAGVMAALKKIDDFDANGLLAKTGPASKRPASCYAMITIKGGKYQRLDPASGLRCDGGFIFAPGG